LGDIRREIAEADLIRTAGFELNDIATGYITGPKPWPFRPYFAAGNSRFA
jgi:hypothetical protein